MHHELLILVGVFFAHPVPGASTGVLVKLMHTEESVIEVAVTTIPSFTCAVCHAGSPGLLLDTSLSTPFTTAVGEKLLIPVIVMYCLVAQCVEVIP